MSNPAFFITGTDTDAGKTTIAGGLLYAAQQQGLSTLATKPVASGCSLSPEGLRNADALHLQAYSTVSATYEEINPFAFEPPIAPHIAAAKANRLLNSARLLPKVQALLPKGADFPLVEGAGGWHVPLNQTERLSDLALQLQLPVILVVGIRLGCINHALLTMDAIQHAGLPLAGWVANQIEPHTEAAQENIDCLKISMRAPCLGVIPHQPHLTAADVAQHIDLSPLLSKA